MDVVISHFAFISEPSFLLELVCSLSRHEMFTVWHHELQSAFFARKCGKCLILGRVHNDCQMPLLIAGGTMPPCGPSSFSHMR